MTFNKADPDSLNDPPDSVTTYLIGDDVICQSTNSDATITYTYDANGSLITKTTKKTSPEEYLETVTYEYNLQKRPIEQNANLS